MQEQSHTEEMGQRDWEDEEWADEAAMAELAAALDDLLEQGPLEEELPQEDRREERPGHGP